MEFYCRENGYMSLSLHADWICPCFAPGPEPRSTEGRVDARGV